MLRRILRPLFAVGAVFLLSHCGARPSVDQPSKSKNIFGPDNRTLLPNTAPYQAIGRLDSGCTGALIGKTIVLTAAHCIYDPATSTVKPTVKWFHPNYRGEGAASDEQSRAWIQSVWLGSLTPEDDRPNDWAFLRVDRDLSSLGAIPIYPGTLNVPVPFTVSLAGYSSDLDGGARPYLTSGCSVQENTEGRYFDDCDSKAGISGAPLLRDINGNRYIVGLAVSEYRQGASDSVERDDYSRAYANVAAPANGFSSLALALVARLDAGEAAPDMGARTTLLPNPNARDGGGGQVGGDDGSDGDCAQVRSSDQLLQEQTSIGADVNSLYSIDSRLASLRALMSRDVAGSAIDQGFAVFDDALRKFDGNVRALVDHVQPSGDIYSGVCRQFGRLSGASTLLLRTAPDALLQGYQGQFQRIQEDLGPLMANLTTLVVRR